MPGSDGLAVQCVGSWAREKHEYLRRYIEATRAARALYLPPQGRGGAGFVDLFAGPGLARVKDDAAVIDGSPLIALDHQEAPFTKLVLCDTDEENVNALKHRADARTEVLAGDCNELIDEVVRHIPPYGLNFALIDPFGAKTLRWQTVEKLGRVSRMDILLHFPTGTIKRNFDHPGFDKTIDELMGITDWRSTVLGAKDVAKLIDIFRERLVTLGYEEDRVRSQAIKNSRGVIMYHLVFASKNRLGNKIWQSITKTTATGQTGWGF